MTEDKDEDTLFDEALHGAIYLDALDEYQTGENGKNKLLQLANIISASKNRR